MATNLLKTEPKAGVNLIRNDREVSASRGLLRSIGQGATFGFADEITAAMVAATAAATGDSFSEVYRDVLFNEREDQETFEAQHPVMSTAGEIGGGLMMAPTVVGRAVAAAPFVGGAATGAVFGAGKSEAGPDSAQFAADVATGATLGGVTAKGADLALKGLGRVVQTRAGRIIKRSINRKGLDNKQVVERVTELGENARLIDVIPDLGEQVAQIPAARPILDDFLETRAGGQQARLIGSLTNLARNTKQYWDNIFELDAKRAQAASPLYKQAFDDGINYNDVVDDVVGKIKGAFPRAWSSARRIAKAGGVDLPDSPPRQMTLKQLDALKQGLDDEVSKAFRSGSKKLGGEGMRLKAELIEELDSQNPVYKAARDAWAGPSAIKDAQEKGRKILTTDFELSVRDIKKMTEGEREGYVIGAVRAVRDKVLSSNPDSNTTRAFRPILKERLRPAFPDDDSFNAFIKVLNDEDTFSAVRNQVLKGSPTAKRMIGADDLAVPAIFLSQGRTVMAASDIARRLFSGRLSDTTAKDVASLLIEEGVSPERITRILAGRGLTDQAAKKIVSTVTLGVSASQ